MLFASFCNSATHNWRLLWIAYKTDRMLCCQMIVMKLFSYKDNSIIPQYAENIFQSERDCSINKMYVFIQYLPQKRNCKI
jgi:hypothetical protein